MFYFDIIMFSMKDFDVINIVRSDGVDIGFGYWFVLIVMLVFGVVKMGKDVVVVIVEKMLRVKL